MNLTKETFQINYELRPINVIGLKSSIALHKKRFLVGRAQTCDLKLPMPEVSAIHALIEIQDKKIIVIDLHSKNGTEINGQKVISSEVKIGDKVSFGGQEFSLEKFNEENQLPPILDTLKVKNNLALPKSVPKIHEEEIPRIVYPLSKDPRADKVQYIFEDAEDIYPIFDYNVAWQSVEVTVLFYDNVLSVDYLPVKEATYYLSGLKKNSQEVEYSYLSKDNRFPFVIVNGASVSINKLPDFDFLTHSDRAKNISASSDSVSLQSNDLFIFKKSKMQIYVRLSDSPPMVQAPPVFQYDKDLFKFLLFFLFFGLLFTIAVFNTHIEKEVEQEKLPERVAKILDQQKVFIKIPKQKLTEVPEMPPVEAKKSEAPLQQKKLNEKTEKPLELKGAVKEVIKLAPPKKADFDRLRPKVTNNLDKGKSAGSGAPAKNNGINTNSPNKGNVDTFKATDFSASLNSLLAKGGGVKSNTVNYGNGRGNGVGSGTGSGSGLSLGEESATLKNSKNIKETGSLAGIAKGKVDNTSGTGGLIDKAGAYTVDIPATKVVYGGMDPDLIRRILLENVPHFRGCYQSELDATTKTFDGKIDLVFTIGASGAVVNAGVKNASNALPDDVRNCVVNVLKGIRFPEPPGAGVVDVRQAFYFYPRSN